MNRNLKNTPVYDQSVIELEELLLKGPKQGAVNDLEEENIFHHVNSQNLQASALQTSILLKTQDMPQQFEESMHQVKPESKSIWARLGLLSSSGHSTGLSGLVAATLLFGVFIIAGNLYVPSTTSDIVAPSVVVEDPDLTFQELWLNEDENLFSEVL